MVIFTINYDVIGLVSTSLHATGFAQAGVDGLIVVGNRYKVGAFGDSLLCAIIRHQVRITSHDGSNTPRHLGFGVFFLSTLGKYLNDIALRDGLPVESHALGTVVLEDESVVPLCREGTDIGGENGVYLCRAFDQRLCGNPR